eukprot:TRINITY_DN43788_c0_g1_i1.p1 TRINITY_DN43788_c0_g1~~TRINITY_DN43788_c0_g1_i1.p1  ORF type:complete len:365 (+),score=97.12 TRINITY_DN43788_c0_g1_i1:56-1096(+)
MAAAAWTPVPPEPVRRPLGGPGWGDTVRGAVVNSAYSVKTRLGDLADYWRPTVDGLRTGTGDVFLLGRRFAAPALVCGDGETAAESIGQVVWFSYRRGFSFGRVSYDTGWGCMHRCGQMLLMSSLRRLPDADTDRLLPLFRDVEDADFSLQKLARAAGEGGCRWLAPSDVARAMAAVMTSFVSRPRRHEVCPHNLHVEEASQEAALRAGRVISRASQDPLLILYHTMLNPQQLPEQHIPSLLECFKAPQCVGIIGARNRQALYLVGCRDAMVFVLDPHRVQAAFVDESTKGDLYEGRRGYWLDTSELAGSFVFGFLVQGKEDARDLIRRLGDVNRIAHVFEIRDGG